MSQDWIADYLGSTQEIRDDYNRCRAEFGYSVDSSYTVLLNGKRYSAFLYHNELRLFKGAPLTWSLQNGQIPVWDRKSIPIDSIQYFAREGQVTSETQISGGGSSSNLTGAVIGGLIAGPAGAIIGGQNKMAPIQSTTVRHDDRKTVLVYNKGRLEFAWQDYEAFMKLIPEKELSVVQLATAQAKQKERSVADQLRELKSLHDEGLLTDEEFEEKRQQLVRQI